MEYDNYSCHILNVDGSCLGTPMRVGLVELLEIMQDTIYQVFLAASMFLLTSCMLSFTLSTWGLFWQKA